MKLIDKLVYMITMIHITLANIAHNSVTSRLKFTAPAQLRSLSLTLHSIACKKIDIDKFTQRKVEQCSIKGKVIHLGQILGAGSFEITYDIGNNDAIKFADNRNANIQEAKMLQTFQNAAISNVVEITENTEMDSTAKVITIGMKKYYKSVDKFIEQDITRLGWTQVSIVQFAAKLGVKLSYSLFLGTMKY